MRNVEIDLGPKQRQKLPEDGHAGDAVDVVIAIDRGLLLLLDGFPQASGRRLDSRHLRRPDQLGQFGLQEHAALGGFGDPAIDHDLGHQRCDLERAGQQLHPLIDGRDDPETLLHPCRGHWDPRYRHLLNASHACVRKPT